MQQQQVQLRKATIIERDAIQLFETNKIEVGSTFMAPKRDIGTDSYDNRVVLSTNVYGLLMKQIPVFRYDVTIYGYTRSERQVELTKKVSGDALHIDRRSKCRDVMEIFKQKYPDFFKFYENNCVYYDLQSIMYSLLRLEVTPKEQSVFPIPVDEVDLSFCRIEVILKTVYGFELTLGDLSKITPDVAGIDHSLEQFLNLASSQHIMINKDKFITFTSAISFMLAPETYGFQPDDSPYFADNGTYLAIGAQKGVRFVEGPRGPGNRNTAIVVESKKTPFHAMEKVIQKASYFVNNIERLFNGEYDRLARQLKGLQVETIYGVKQRFLITGVSQESAMEKRILFGESRDREISIQQYFQEKYGITLQYPTTPLIEARGRDGNTNFYPMELCIISDNQRVKSHQQTPRQIQDMIKKCAVPPGVLRDHISFTTQSMALENNEWLKNAKIKFIKDPLSVNARVLSPPSLQYSQNFVAQVRTDNFNWQGKGFLIPAKCRIWAAYAFSGGSRDTINQRDFETFITRYLNEARMRGMKISDPADVRYGNSDPEVLKSELRIAAQNGCEFVLVAHPDAADEMHAALKLCERDFQMTTQGLKIGTIRNVVNKGQVLTVQNIVNKTNVKLGGLNYSLNINSSASKEILGTDTLFVGLGMAHPAGGLGMGGDGNGSKNDHSIGNGSDNGSGSDGSDLLNNKPPSVVGYAANIGKNHNFEFVGDFIYQETRRDEKINIIRDVIKRCVTSYRENHGKDPRRIMLYRNGCAEGQFPLILKYEIPLIKTEVEQLSCKARLTVIVSNKLQNMRFFNNKIDKRSKPTEQNIRPGTVVDSCVVHPCFCEFFLNSHRALQGTARTPKYTVIYDDNSLTLDQLEGITYQLCYGHQIVYMPTSLPSPVYIANCYAERGQRLYRRYKAVSSSDVEPRKCSELTLRLGYENVSVFSHRRINA